MGKLIMGISSRNHLLLLWLNIAAIVLKLDFAFAICPLRSVRTEYTPKGHAIKLANGMDVYETKSPSSPSVALIGVYEWYSFSTNVLQLADKISKGGFLVVIPDFFRGGYKIAQSPATNRDARNAFMEIDKNKGNRGWASVKEDLLTIVDHYKSKGVTKFGIFGWCWGGRMVVDALSAADLGDYLAGALIHPCCTVVADADKILRPLAFLATAEEKSYAQQFFNKINIKFPERCEIHDFYDMEHGFAGGAGNFDDPTIQKRVIDLIHVVKAYFKKQLK